MSLAIGLNSGSSFDVNEVCIVADRGMISAATVEQIKERGWRYILGVRMRRFNEANQEVLARAGRYEQVYPKSKDPKAPSPLKVKCVGRGSPLRGVRERRSSHQGPS